MSPKNFLSPRNVTVQNVMPFYPDIIMAPKFWLSPRNVTLENVTTYFVRQMNRPLDVFTTKIALDRAKQHQYYIASVAKPASAGSPE